jgi:hypothetical protein
MIVIDAICDASGIVWEVKFGLKFIFGFEWEEGKIRGGQIREMQILVTKALRTNGRF